MQWYPCTCFLCYTFTLVVGTNYLVSPILSGRFFVKKTILYTFLKWSVKAKRQVNQITLIQNVKHSELSMQKGNNFLDRQTQIEFDKMHLRCLYLPHDLFFKSSICSKTVTIWIWKTRSTTMEKRGAFGYRWARQKVEP